MGHKNISGIQFGRLKAIEWVGTDIHNHSLWMCECSCGNKITVPLNALTRGNTRSCGCLFIDTVKQGLHVTHGKSNTKTYRTWAGMKRRCLHKHSKDYKYYGGRGIKICDEWVNSFQSFYDYVSHLPHFNEEGFSIDRINVNGNYECGNVRWASAIEQSRNRRNIKRKD